MILEQKTLENKLNTLLIDSPGSNTATIQIWFKAGSSIEQKADHGIAHFLEHMFFKGTKKYPNVDLAKTVESFGGEFNAFTSFDYTCYYINAPSKNITDSIDVLLDMVTNPSFLEKDIAPERNVVFEEYRRSVDNAGQFNFSQIQKNCFKGGYQHQILGTEKNIKSFSREQLISFREKFYNTGSAFFVVAGDLKNKEKIEKVITQFQLPIGDAPKQAKFGLKNESKINSHNKATNQLSFNLTIEAPDYLGKLSPIEDLALNCLTFGDISPLYKELVLKDSIASSVSGSTMFFNNKGVHFLKASMPSENFSAFLSRFEKEIIRVLKTGFSIEEIERIRNQYISSKIYEKESIESYAFSLGHSYAQTGDLNCEDSFIGVMKKATTKSVHKALLDIFERFIHVNIQYPQNAKKSAIEKRIEQFRTKINKEAARLQKSFKAPEYQTSKIDPSLKIIELKKNVKLIHRQNLMTPTFVLHAYIKGGISHETDKTNGIYNLIAKNMTYGHTNIDYDQLKLYLESHSAYLNGFSGKNAYGLTLHGLSDNFKDLSSHFFKTLTSPSNPAKYFKLEKELINRTIHIQKEDPVKHCFSNFVDLVFNNHPYAMNAIGTQKSIKSISRKSIIDTHQEKLNNSEIVFTYCGDLDTESVIEIIEPLISEIKPRKSMKIKKKKIMPIHNQSKQIDFDREQTHIMIGKSAFQISTNEDLYLKMFTTYLSGQSSELFVEVRDRMGLCYSCQPLHLTAIEGGYWGIYIGSGHDKKDLAIKAIMDIINKYQSKGISKKEFGRIKKMIMGQNLLNIQTNDDYASFYSIPVLHNLGVDFQHKTISDINKLKHEDFNKFLAKYLKGDWNTIEVGRNPN
jgi:zinc protease